MRRSEFCRSRGLSFGALNWHLKKRRWKKKIRAASSAGRLVPVELAVRKRRSTNRVVDGRGAVGRAPDRGTS